MSKPKQSKADLYESDDDTPPAWRGRARVDRRLASLYQGTLEDTIPDDLLRLVARLGELQARKS